MDYSYAWKKLCKKAGITALNVHDLRRTYSTWMRKISGADRETIAKALHHDSVTSTKIYDIIENKALKEKRNNTVLGIVEFSSNDNSLVRQLQETINNDTNIISDIINEQPTNSSSVPLANLMQLKEMYEKAMQLINYDHLHHNVA